jgi:hypothetical protein
MNKIIIMLVFYIVGRLISKQVKEEDKYFIGILIGVVAPAIANKF